MRNRLLPLVAVLLTALGAHAAPAKNVIIMLADGMGYNHIEAASFHRFGAPRGQSYWKMQHLPITTYSTNNKEGYPVDKLWADFKYFLRVPTDSSAAATAISSGVKCPNARVGLSKEGEPLPHMLYDAERLGKATGLVSTVRLSHATPASFSVHDVGRANEEPIARKMLLESAVDLIIAPGHPWRDDDGREIAGAGNPDAGNYTYVGGLELWNQLRAGAAGGDADGDGNPDPWTLLDATDAIVALADAPQPARILGLVPVGKTLQVNRSGDVMADAFTVPFTPGLPTLAQLARAALAQLAQDPDGFYLMIEGGAVDWAGHDNRPGRLIEEQIDFDLAVEAVEAWIEQHSNWDETMLFITADHECGYLTGPGSDPDWKPLVNNGQGNMPGMEFHSPQHTNQLVPVFAKGAGVDMLLEYVYGADPRHGDYADNTDISKVIRRAWGVPLPPSDGKIARN